MQIQAAIESAVIVKNVAPHCGCCKVIDEDIVKTDTCLFPFDHSTGAVIEDIDHQIEVHTDRCFNALANTGDRYQTP